MALVQALERSDGGFWTLLESRGRIRAACDGPIDLIP